MILDLKIKNSIDFMKKIIDMVPYILLEYEENYRYNLILNLIIYLELQLNCILRPLEVTYKSCKNSFVLPLWPINKIVNVFNKSGKEEKFLLNGNRINIENPSGDNQEEFTIIYDVGYEITILEQHIPLIILLSLINTQFLNKIQNICCHKDMEKIFNQLREIYGKGDI